LNSVYRSPLFLCTYSAPPVLSTLSLHDALPISMQRGNAFVFDDDAQTASIEKGTLIVKCCLEDGKGAYLKPRLVALDDLDTTTRSEEHTSELQSRFDLVCRLLLEKKNDASSGPS